MAEVNRLDEPIMVLEHDALFTRKFRFSDLTDGFKGGIVGLNDLVVQLEMESVSFEGQFAYGYNQFQTLRTTILTDSLETPHI